MQVIGWPDFIKNGLQLRRKKSSITVGVFDGVHRGHQALIKRLTTISGQVPVVITFRENHKTTGGLQTFQERIEALERLGIKITVVIDFTESFKRMAGTEFLEILLKRGSIGFFAVGSDFRCGHQLDTDAAAIQKFFAAQNIPVEIVPEVLEAGLPISSSRIRAALAAGNLALAEKMLGRALMAEREN